MMFPLILNLLLIIILVKLFEYSPLEVGSGSGKPIITGSGSSPLLSTVTHTSTDNTRKVRITVRLITIDTPASQEWNIFWR